LRNALADAVRWGELERNVAALARPPAAPRTPVAAMTTGDLQSLLKGIAGHRFERIYRLAVTMGLRRSELLGLMWEDVDFNEKVLHVRRGLQRSKGAGITVQAPKSETSRRDLAIPESALTTLKAQKQWQAAARLKAGTRWQESGYVFTTQLGGPVNPDDVSREFKYRARDADLPNLTLHQLRHGAATLMLAHDVPLKTVQETLGHSTIAITADIYGHVVMELKRAAADAIDAAMEKATRKAGPQRIGPKDGPPDD